MPTTQPNLNLESLYRPLWLTYGLVPLLAGLDKFFNLLTDWPKYLRVHARPAHRGAARGDCGRARVEPAREAGINPETSPGGAGGFRVARRRVVHGFPRVEVDSSRRAR